MRRGDLVTVALNGDYGKPRPALVVQSDYFNGTESITVLLLTSTLFETSLMRHTIEPDQTNGLRALSQVQIDRAMTVPRSKVGSTIGRLDDASMVTITRLLATFLGIV